MGSHVGRCFTARRKMGGTVRDVRDQYRYVLYFRSNAGGLTYGEEVDQHGAWAPALVRRVHGALGELHDQIVHGCQALPVCDFEQGPCDVSVKYRNHCWHPHEADRRGA